MIRMVFAPAAGEAVTVEGQDWYLLDAAATGVEVVATADFASEARSWAAGSEAPDYTAFTRGGSFEISGLSEGLTDLAGSCRPEI